VNYRVRISEAALRDLDRLIEFLEVDTPAVAARLRRSLLAALESLQLMPNRGRLGPADYREIVVPFGRAGYVIRYVVRGQHVDVARIKHSRELG
jgi:plasmid stabilization system protein ParE